MPRVQIDDQIVELTDDEYAEQGYSLDNYINYNTEGNDTE